MLYHRYPTTMRGKETMTKNSHTTVRHQRGFTLVEIMVTLVIMAIAAALVSPAIMQMAPNMALKSAAQDLYSNLQRAKIAAIKENNPALVVINASSYSYYIDVNRDGAYTASAVDTLDDDANGDGMYNQGENFTDNDGNGVYSGEIAVTTNFSDYGYGIVQGTGKATKNWDDAACTQAASIQFNSRGFLDLPGSQSVYIQNKNADISYAVTAQYSGTIKGRKYDGATPFNKDHWVQ